MLLGLVGATALASYFFLGWLRRVLRDLTAIDQAAAAGIGPSTAGLRASGAPGTAPGPAAAP